MIDERDLVIRQYRSAVPRPTDVSVSITHVPTGITAEATMHESEHPSARLVAERILRIKLALHALPRAIEVWAEDWPHGLRHLSREAVMVLALADLLGKAAETFGDVAMALRALGYPKMAAACEVAERHSWEPLGERGPGSAGATASPAGAAPAGSEPGPVSPGEPTSREFGHLLATEFALRGVLDEEDASDAVMALRERGFVVLAPMDAVEAALEREAKAAAERCGSCVGGGMVAPGDVCPECGGDGKACPYGCRVDRATGTVTTVTSCPEHGPDA